MIINNFNEQEIISQVASYAAKCFPAEVDQVVSILTSYIQLQTWEFKAGKMVQTRVSNPNFTEQLKGWEKNRDWVVNDESLAQASSGSENYQDPLEPPSPWMLGKRFDRHSELLEALSFLPVATRANLEVKIRVLGERDELCRSDSADPNNLYDFGKLVCASELEKRVLVNPHCMEYAKQIVRKSNLQARLLRLLKSDGAYKYYLVSHEHLSHIMASVLDALEKAIVLAVVLPDPGLVQQVLRFVDFQLSGTPIVKYENDVVELLVAIRDLPTELG